jgi:hypothetical protein
MGVNTALEKTDSISQVVGLCMGADLIETFTSKSNLYHKQNSEKCKSSVKLLKWLDIMEVEMKKFLGQLVLMGQV